jgi:hypothetical protein
MKNPNLTRYPTPEELYALEHEARRLRAAEMARLFRAGIKAVRSLFQRERTVTVRNAKGLKHA